METVSAEESVNGEERNKAGGVAVWGAACFVSSSS